MPHPEVIIDRIHVDVFKHVGGKTIQQKLPISVFEGFSYESLQKP